MAQIPSTTVDPESLVEAGSIAESDLPVGATSENPIAPLDHSTDTCKPIASSPFLAGAFSAEFSWEAGNFTLIAKDEVAVEPTEAIASQVANTFSAQTWMQTCDEPSDLQNAEQQVQDTASQSNCQLSLASHDENALSATGLPAGAVGWTFHTLVHCSNQNSDWTTTSEEIFTHVGKVVLAFFIDAIETAQPAGQASNYTLSPDNLSLVSTIVNRVHQSPGS